MKDITKKWLEFVDGDQKAAWVQFEYGEKRGNSYQIAIFHSHQAVEKMLNAIFGEQGKEIIKIHNLVRLLALTNFTLPVNIRIALEDLNPHYLPPRYPELEFKPGFTFSYSAESVKKVLLATDEIILCLKKILDSNR